MVSPEYKTGAEFGNIPICTILPDFSVSSLIYLLISAIYNLYSSVIYAYSSGINVSLNILF